MPSEGESAVAAFFHLSRSLGKKRRDVGADRIVEAMVARAIAMRNDRRADDQAERWAWERQWG